MSKQKDPFPLRVIRTVLPLMEFTVPFAARKLAHRFFFYPISYPFPTYEIPYIDKALTETLLFEDTSINIYQWGNRDSKRKVLLVHGWAGRATQFRVIIDALTSEGFHVISYDAPGHGKSDGKTSDLPQMARIIKLLQNRFEIKNLIGHSMGGAACLFSIVRKDVIVDRLIMISAPTSAESMLTDFLNKINGSSKLKTYLSDKILELFEHPLTYYFANNLLPHTNIPSTLAIHDIDDPEVHFNHITVLKQHVKGLQTYTTYNLGHTKILRDEGVIEGIKLFLSKTT